MAFPARGAKVFVSNINLLFTAILSVENSSTHQTHCFGHDFDVRRCIICPMLKQFIY